MPAAPESRVDTKLVGKAVDALLKHHEKESANSNSLLGNDSPVWIQFGLEKVPAQGSPKPRRVNIPHPLWKLSDDDDGEEPSVCLIVKEESKEWVQALIAEFPKEMGLVKKVMGLDSLRQKHAKFAQQRALLNRFDVFMADDRILPMLGKALGKNFFSSKKNPIPVRLTRKTNLPVMVLQSLQSTFWYLSEGTCLSVKAGHTGMDAKKLRENMEAICKHVPQQIPRQWANIRLISIKTSDSVSLPMYNKTPEELKAIAKLAGLEETKVAVKVTKEVEKKADDAAATKKRKAKSPLLQALKKKQNHSEQKEKLTKKTKRKNSNQNDEDASPPKKQKKMDTPKTTDSTPKLKAANTPKDKSEATPKSKAVNTPKDKSEVTPKAKTDDVDTTPKDKSGVKKAEAKTDATPSKKSDVTPKAKTNDTPSKKKSEVTTPKTNKADATPKKSDKQSELTTPKAKTNATPKTSDKKKKDMSTPTTTPAVTPKSKSKSAVSSTSSTPTDGKSFMASKKFTGSKKGYAFKMGPKGMGYYVDTLPVVDKMAMEAIVRVSQQRRSGGSGKKGRKGGRR